MKSRVAECPNRKPVSAEFSTSSRRWLGEAASEIESLHGRFLPIVKRSTAKVDLAQRYNDYAQKGAAVGLIRKEQADLDEYVTQKALDGLYFMVGEEEKKIRQDPVQAGSDIIRKVFGALK